MILNPATEAEETLLLYRLIKRNHKNKKKKIRNQHLNYSDTNDISIQGF